MRNQLIVASGLSVIAALFAVPACSASDAANACANGRIDDGETGVDCGGSCPQSCDAANLTGPHANGVRDSGETDVDCGGPTAPKCAEGKSCATNEDCVTNDCPAETKVCHVASSTDGLRNGTETDVDCGGEHAPKCAVGMRCASNADCADNYCPDATKTCVMPLPDDAIKNGFETDVDCGGRSAPQCAEGKACLVDTDCIGACNYASRCVDAPSCKPNLGGDTCGLGEVGQPGAVHESCCRTLLVRDYTDPAHPGKKVYLDKYEITAGRVRSFIEQLAAVNGGVPDVKSWIAAHRPKLWEDDWDAFLPSDLEGPTITIARRLLGDPRPEDEGWTGPPGPGVILPPPSDQPRRLGVNYQFGSEIYVDLHGNNCGTHPDTYGFPTFYYPPDILARDGQLPRADGKTHDGSHVSAKDLLDVKSMNCITNAMLAAFCAWDGGQLATDEVLDYVTATPDWLGNTSGCGSQRDDHGALLLNSMAGTVQSGGRCPPVASVNATFDAGDVLPVPDSPLNRHNYWYPDTGLPTHDKSWQVSAPGRGSLASTAGTQLDVIRIEDGDEPWMDLHGNLNEAALDVSGEWFTGKFAVKLRGLGYGSARSTLNVDPVRGEGVLRVQRPEAKAAYIGGRCMRFK